MELLYVWIEEYNNIHHQGFNFSPKHHFHFEPNEKEGPVTGGTLTHEDINPNYPDNFFGKNISNITAIVGKNGSGKSSLVKAICDAIHFIEKIVLVYKHNKTLYYWKNIPNINTEDIQLIEEDESNIYLGHVIYYSPFINSNRNYLFDWSDASEISSMERMANALFSVANNPNKKITATAPKQIYHHLLSAYCAQEMTSQINFIKEITGSKKQFIPDSIVIPEDIELGIPFFEEDLSVHRDEFLNDFILLTIVNALNRDIFQKGKVREEEFSYAISQKKAEDWLKDICNKRDYDIEEIKTFCKQLNDKIPDLVNYRDKDEGSVLNFKFPYLDLPREILFKQKTGARSNWVNDLAVTLTWHDLSDGEATMLSLFARLWEKLQKVNHSSIILLDEFELGLHPQWQKESISKLISFFSLLSKKGYHIILTTHSPILLSDLPRENIIFLDKNEDGNSAVKAPQDMDSTFGANIHSLYRSSFFMDGLMGKFAEGKINDVIKDLRGSGEITEERKKEIRFIIDTIGEDVLRTGLEKLYEGRFPFTEKDKLEKEIELLKQKQAEAERKLKALK